MRRSTLAASLLFYGFLIVPLLHGSVLFARTDEPVDFTVSPQGSLKLAQAGTPFDRPQAPASRQRQPLQPAQTSQPSVPLAHKAPVAPPAAGMVQMEFDNIELRDLIRFVSTIMGKNFVYDEAAVKGKVTLLSPRRLTKDEMFRVFESVLNYHGFSIVETPEALKIVRSADAKGMAVETLDRTKFMEVSPEERITTLVYPLEYLDSNTMVGTLRPLMSRDAYLVSVPSANALIMIDTSANLQRLKTLISEVDLPVSKQLSGIEVYDVQNTNAADLAKTLQALLAEGKKAQTVREKIFVTAYPPTNSLLISAPPEDMKEIMRIVGEMDTYRPQVLVEAAIVEMTLTKTQTLGVEWLTGGSVKGTQVIGGSIIGTDPTSGAALVPLVSGLSQSLQSATTTTTTATTTGITTALGALKSGLNIGVLGQTITFDGVQFANVQAFVQALAVDQKANILSTPQLLTVNNEEAEVLVGSNIPYTTSVRLDSAGNPITNFDYRDVGVHLKVKPYINKDDLVYLNIFAEVTTVQSTTAQVGSGVQTAPTTNKRSTKTAVEVRDNQTIVISGIIEDNREDTNQGIPLLRSIPIIGSLFGYSAKSDTRTNLLVFLTPKIVYDAKTLQKISDELKSRQEKLLGSQGRSK